MQLIGSGAHGPQAADVIRQVAAQNGVWSLGSFGGVPPSTKSAQVVNPTEPTHAEEHAVSNGFLQVNQIDPLDYRFFFNSCGIGMVSFFFLVVDKLYAS